MNPEEFPPLIGARGAGGASARGGLVGRIVASIAWGAVLVLSLLFSAVVFAVLLVVGLVVLGYFWWRTRELRKRMREVAEQQAAARPAGGRVIDGEVIRD